MSPGAPRACIGVRGVVGAGMSSVLSTGKRYELSSIGSTSKSAHSLTDLSLTTGPRIQLRTGVAIRLEDGGGGGEQGSGDTIPEVLAVDSSDWQALHVVDNVIEELDLGSGRQQAAAWPGFRMSTFLIAFPTLTCRATCCPLSERDAASIRLLARSRGTTHSPEPSGSKYSARTGSFSFRRLLEREDQELRMLLKLDDPPYDWSMGRKPLA